MSNRIPSLVALKLISTRLSAVGVNHALGGSGLLYALGLLEEVKDWDITTDATFEAVLLVLQGLEWKRIPPSDTFKSEYFININIDGTPIHLIGGFAIKTSFHFA